MPRRRLHLAVCAIVVLAPCSVGLGAHTHSHDQAPVRHDTRTPTERREAAEQVARVNAVRKLVEQLCDLRLKPGARVQAFAADTGLLATDARAFVQGAKEVAPARSYADGTCEVTMQISVKQVVENLKKIKKDHYKGKTFAGEDFADLPRLNAGAVLSVVGIGSDRYDPEQVAAAKVVVPAFPEVKGSEWPSKTAGIRGWRQARGRERLKAEHAAVRAARDKIAERARGLQATPGATVGDFILQKPGAKTAFQEFIEGLRVERMAYLPGGIVEAEVRLPLATLVKELKEIKRRFLKDDKNISADGLDQIAARAGTPEFVECGHAAISGKPARAEEIAEVVPAKIDSVPRIVLVAQSEEEKPVVTKGTEE